MTDDSLRLRVRTDAPTDTVFKALTDADSLTDWLAESADVSLEDNRYQFWGRYAPQGDRPRQQLLAAEPGQALSFTWAFDDAASSGDAGDSADAASSGDAASCGDAGGAQPSRVEVTMAPDDGGGTVVTVVHTGVPTSGTADTTALDCFWHVSLANLAAQCEGLPTMPPFDFSVPAQGDALVRTVIDVPPDEVFACLLDPTQVDKWAKAKAVIEPEVGGRYDFGWGDHGPAQVLELEPDKVLAYSWRYPDSPDTVVRWALRSSRGSTYLTLVHSGFDNDRLAEEFRQGWPGFLVEIKRILELGDHWEPLKL